MVENEEQRFGSADFSGVDGIDRAGMFDQQPNSIFMGFAEGRPIYYSGPAGVTCTAGARAGKMKDWLAYNILTGTCLHSLVMLDLKGEGAAISWSQTADRKFCAFFNPTGFHGIHQDRFNFCDHIRIDSRFVVTDTKVFCENFISDSGSPSGKYFEGRAREVLEAFALSVTEQEGVLTLPRLYDAVMLSVTPSDAWHDFGFEMSESRFPIVRRLEAEIAANHAGKGGGDGWSGIMGEVFRSLACLSDPVLLDAVSPPYTASMASLCDSDQAWQIYLMPPPEAVSAWSPVLKSAFVNALAWKSRAPSAPRQTWFLDECGQLATGATSGFALLPKMFTLGAGLGLQPVAVFQTNKQMKALAENAEELIQSSAGAKLMFTLRDEDSAQSCSTWLGKQTLSYDDDLQQSRARTNRRNSLLQLFSGGDPLQAALSMAQSRREALHRTKQQRDLMTVDEVMRMRDGEAILFADGLKYPAKLQRKPYWEQTFKAGRFPPNPYHGRQDQVTIATPRGPETRRVITAPVPKRFAHYPQYRDGMWTYVDGFKDV